MDQETSRQRILPAVNRQSVRSPHQQQQQLLPSATTVMTEVSTEAAHHQALVPEAASAPILVYSVDTMPIVHQVYVPHDQGFRLLVAIVTAAAKKSSTPIIFQL